MKIKLPSLHQLDVFATVAKTGSVSKAAAELFLTQPAVSILLKKLEKTFNVQLTEVVARRIHLTKAGEIVLRHYENIVTELHAMHDEIEDQSNLITGEMTIGMVSSAKYFMPQAINKLTSAYPGISAKLVILNRETLAQKLLRNELDLAIFGLLPEHSNIDSTRFRDNPVVFAAPYNHPLTQKKQLSIADLAKEPILLREDHVGIRIITDELFKAAGVKPQVAMELSSTEAIKQAIIANIGISIIPLECLELELASKRIAILDVIDFPIMLDWYYAIPGGKTLSPAVRKLTEILCEQIK